MKWARDPFRGRPRGFSLVEAMLATAITAVLGLVIFSVFYYGVTIWNRATGNFPAEGGVLFWEKFQNDVRNIVPYADNAFHGEPERVIFYAVIPPRSAEIPHAVGIITYRAQLGDGKEPSMVLFRNEGAVQETAAVEGNQERALAAGFLSCRFEYGWFYDKQGRMEWVEQWPPAPDREQEAVLTVPPVPAWIRIRLRWKERSQIYEQIRTVMIPAEG